MTRDTYRVHDDRDTHHDAEVYTALSRASVPFSRLPDDAPSELRKLTVELDDPKRVYIVHRASRRHHFQLLVERYIHQIRYGCESNTCTTSTCFSCRRRLANGAPVRRYNATSARTLATYMASQDNPERGLCRNPAASRPTPDINKTKNPKRRLRDAQGPSAGKQATTEDIGRDPLHDRRKSSIDDVRRKAMPDLSVVDEFTNTDPRSFVQNVFGTVAFKMLEWLTPRNLDLLVRAHGDDTANSPSLDETSASLSPPSKIPLEGPKLQSSKPTLDAIDDMQNRVEDKKIPSTKIIEPPSPPASIPNAQLSHAREPKLSPSSELHPSTLSKLLTATNDTLESQHLKGILSKVPKPTECMSDTTHPSRQYSPIQRRLSRKLSSNSSQGTTKDGVISILPDAKSKTTKTTPHSLESEEIKDEDNNAQNPKPHRPNQINEDLQRESESSRSNRLELSLLPQSLSQFSIETIEFLCNVMQIDGNSERHPLHPAEIGNSLKRRRNKSTPLSRTREPTVAQSPSLKHFWKSFIEQSFFDVLSQPDSLLRSFRDEDGQPLDTQTIWYLMLRMTRVAPSIVFDSLWRVAANLFQPPENLESTNDWIKDAGRPDRGSGIPMSNHDAAEIINICLHALVAAAPLVSNKQELASMSRIRSYGLATRGSESASQEHITLCLQYEDAFTYDLAVRLARRIFAAIPTRRRFTELLDLQNSDRDDVEPEPDVLETVIKSLRFLDLGSEPFIDFPEAERDLHEKRMPTLILDWARAVMLQEWQGAAKVPRDGAFGGALATIQALYENRKALLLGDIHFRTEYFAERLDPVEIPMSWLSFESNKRMVHLLDYPYLFNPSTLVTYFRALNFSRMNRAYESAKASSGLVYSFVAESSLPMDKYRRDQLYRRLDTATTKFNVLEIGRTAVLKDTFNAIWRREERELLRPLKVRLGQDDGDEGMDSGGVQQEFFRLAIAEAVNPDYGAFTIDPTTQMIWFQPGSPEPLWKFELIGMVVSLAVYNGLTLPVTFPKALYRKLLDEEVTELHHIEDGWPDIEKNLTHLLEWDEQNGLVEETFVLTYEFSADVFGKPVSCEMGSVDQWPQFADLPPASNPEAPMVTNENRNSYVSDYIHWMTDVSVRPQFNAFRKGFFSCIDRRSISLFDADTLQSLVEGIQEIEISEMRRATNYVGWNASHRTVRDFWSIVKRYSLDQKRKLLEFTTASDRVPVGGMKNIQFTLQRNGVDDSHLPTSYTCYGILLLPEYSSKEVLREKLAMALENSKGFGFA